MNLGGLTNVQTPIITSIITIQNNFISPYCHSNNYPWLPLNSLICLYLPVLQLYSSASVAFSGMQNTIIHWSAFESTFFFTQYAVFKIYACYCGISNVYLYFKYYYYQYLMLQIKIRALHIICKQSITELHSQIHDFTLE